MDLKLILAYVPVVFRELLLHKFKVFFCFALVSLVVLVVGSRVNSSFTTSATIYADNQNILKPLLAQKAAVTKISEHTRVVREAIYAPSLLQSVVEKEFGPAAMGSEAEIDEKINRIRGRLKVEGLGASYIKINYTDSSPEKTFDILNAVIDQFIRESSASRRAESQEAFQFIDSQVKQYKEQLVSAEEQLKKFKTENFDGRESDVDSSISSIRSELEDLEIDIDEQRSRVAVLNKQLSQENREVEKRYKSDVYRDRIAELRNRLDAMLLTFKESHPDVINIRYQIKDTEAALLEAQSMEMESAINNGGAVADASISNPYYDELRTRLSDAEVELNSMIRRKSANERRLKEEFSRRGRIATQQAELAELTRDYSVTKDIYDDMLARKEKARLSMTLSSEGQGVNYKMQEPPKYPSTPEGARFLHYVLAGPLIGLLLPLGVIIAYVILDHRVRFPFEAAEATKTPILTVVPHIRTPIAVRMLKSDMLMLSGMTLALLLTYAGLAYAFKLGVIF